MKICMTTCRVLLLCLLMPLWCAAVKPYAPTIADPILEPWRWREMEELADLDILSIDEAADGVIWFGCIGGLARYDGRQIERIPFDDGLLSGIAHDPNRTPWGKSVLCLRNGGLLAVVENGLVLRTDWAWKVCALVRAWNYCTQPTFPLPAEARVLA
ncbi:MAG: hypothetical protein JRC77_07980 [Deltaproteobacteria bacterium]|nr:hypothetical protein [Deltaproteobacteria bacterium]